MAEWTFTGSGEKGPVVARSADYDNATDVMFRFPTVKAGFRVPSDVTVQEMAESLERTAKNLRSGVTALIVPGRYDRERRAYIKKMQEEEA